MPPAAQAAHDVDDQPISSAEMAGRGDDAKAIVGTEPPAAAVSDSEDASAQAASATEAFTFSVNVKSKAYGFNLQLQVTSSDSVLDIRQFLSEAHETCFYTCYNLRLDGNELNDYTELSEIAGLKPECTLELVDGVYDERSARLHVRRLREVLANPPAFFPGVTPHPSHVNTGGAINPSAGKKDKRLPSAETVAEGSHEVREAAIALESKVSSTDTAAVSLTQFHADVYCSNEGGPLPSVPKCVKAIEFSCWNPPPRQRKLRGDLVYLVITTADSRTMQVTCSTTGFFVNKSSAEIFDPTEADQPHRAATLAGLLQYASPMFKKLFAKLLMWRINQDPFSSIPVAFPSTCWVGKSGISHVVDANQHEDSLMMAYGLDSRGLLRDWNEEYQSCKELPRTTVQERILRDRAFFKVGCDFVEAAVKGASAVIDKNIPPINPMEPARSHMFVYNNIFFSYAVDSREQYKDAGGDEATYQSANNDILGITQFNKMDIEGLYTLATVVVDYRGFRVVAQGIIPGILHGDQLSSLAYGSVDNGKSIHWHQEFHEKLAVAAKTLNLKEHLVKDESGKEFLLNMSVECKGIVGSDNRKYILDLVRTTARDPKFSSAHHAMAVLRPELVRRFCEHKRQQANVASSDSTAGSSQGKSSLNDEANSFSLNPDCMTNFELGGTAEQTSADAALLTEAGQYLTNQVLPQLLRDFHSLDLSPVDSSTLCDAMHAYGVNLRYIGRVAQETAGSLPHIEWICIREMISRVGKHMFRETIRETEDALLSERVCMFLNHLLGAAEHIDELSSADAERGASVREAEKKDAAKKKKKSSKKAGTAKATDFKYSRKTFWQEMHSAVRRRFDYTLSPQLLKDENFVSNKLQLLRSFCKKVGIQVVARDYDLSSSMPFSSNDINSLYPVVKHTIQPSKDATDLLEMGKALLSIGRLDKAFEVLQEALSILHQTCGPMHALTASCYSNLAMTLYSAGDINQALAYQQKALIINERVHGLDHPDTAHSYGNLALFCHGLQKTDKALSYIQRALFLLKLSCGSDHPDIAATYINMAMMYQDMGNVPLSLRYLHEAKEKNHALLGASHIQTATTYHAMAVTMSVIGLYSLSVKHETKTFEILSSKLGDKDQRTRESAVWLAYFKQHMTDAAQGQKKLPPQTAKIDSQPVLFANGGVKGVPLQSVDVPEQAQPADAKKGKKGKK